MKKLFMLFIVLSLTTIYAQEKSGPKIVAVEPKVDLGEIVEGTILNHDFVIKNEGDEVLEIERVRASCGCTAVTPDKNILEPGESTNIAIQFDSKRRFGRQTKHIYVFSNDKEAPQLRLTFTANVIKQNEDGASSAISPKLNLATNQYNFHTVKSGEVVKKNIMIKNTGEGELVISGIESSCDCITAKVDSKTLMPQEEEPLKIIFDTADRVGQMSRTIVIKSNDPNTPQQVITLFINIKDGNS